MSRLTDLCFLWIPWLWLGDPLFSFFDGCKMVFIVFKGLSTPSEIIDEAASQNEAFQLAAEYRLAFGSSGRVSTVRADKIDINLLRDWRGC